jgi:hypothetical protein
MRRPLHAGEAMNDIRARLADALTESADWFVAGGKLVSIPRAVDVLLSLPGIAIVDMSRIDEMADAIWQHDRDGIGPRPGMWADLSKDWQGYYRNMALAALLAAANKAEGAAP